MDDGVRLMLMQDVIETVAMADIELIKVIGLIFRDAAQGVEIGRVGELVNIDNRCICMLDEMTTERRTDETSAPGDEYVHRIVSPDPPGDASSTVALLRYDDGLGYCRGRSGWRYELNEKGETADFLDRRRKALPPKRGSWLFARNSAVLLRYAQ